MNPVVRAPSPTLIAALRAVRPCDAWLEQHAGGFHIFGTLGVDFLLMPNGVMLRYDWQDGDNRSGVLSNVIEGRLANAVLRLASRDVPELRELLPASVGTACAECSDLVDRRGVLHACATCDGTGLV